MGASDHPLVSFVVLCYNTERYVSECIRSILAQRGDFDFEVIAVDDCSRDGTREELRSLSCPQLQLIEHRENQGHAASINEALREARGTYIARIDSDDRYRPDFLAVTIPKLEQHREVGMVYGDAAVINDRGEQTEAGSDRRHGGRDFKGMELIPLLAENFICAPTIVARREAWLGCLPVPEGLAFHDWYFTLLMARDYEFYYVNQVLADYRVHAGNLHTRITLDKTEESSILWMLERVFGQIEKTPELEREKRRRRRRIYASQYWTMANKYFGAAMNDDARRCYRAVVRHSPVRLLSWTLLRRLAATYLDRNTYEEFKRFVKPAVPGR